jgi:hypothetical protein
VPVGDLLRIRAAELAEYRGRVLSWLRGEAGDAG